MNVSVTLEGGDELIRKLERMGRNVSRSVDSAAQAGIRVIARDAESRLGDRIEMELEERSDGSATYAAGPPKEKWYLQFKEFGAQPHEITGNPLAFQGREGPVITGRVSHPGMAAEPFLRPAFDSKKGEAIDKVGDVILQAVNR